MKSFSSRFPHKKHLHARRQFFSKRGIHIGWYVFFITYFQHYLTHLDFSRFPKHQFNMGGDVRIRGPKSPLMSFSYCGYHFELILSCHFCAPSTRTSAPRGLTMVLVYSPFSSATSPRVKMLGRCSHFSFFYVGFDF